MKQQTIVLIQCQVKPGHSEQAHQAFTRLIATVQDEEQDCISIHLHHSDEDPQRLMLYERWTSREAYQGAHMQTPYMQAFIQDSMAFLTGPPEITFWREIESEE